VVDEVFDLFDALGATEEQLDFPVVFTSATEGTSSLDPEGVQGDMSTLLDTIIAKVPAPDVDVDGPFQLQISALDYSSYVGVIGIGRISRGQISTNTPVVVVDHDGKQRSARVLAVLGHHGLERIELPEAGAGDIVCVTGVDGIGISDTVCAPDTPEGLPALAIDEPTVRMSFCVNTSPYAGIDGKYLTSRQLRERLFREASHNVALKVEETADPDVFNVSGRGELHLAVLIETMRREGYEMAVSRPQVITREEHGVTLEPFEELTIDIEAGHQGKVMEALGERRAEFTNMEIGGDGRNRLSYRIASRALMGFRPQFLSMTNGTGIMSYGPAGHGKAVPGGLGERSNGVLVSMVEGKAVGFALFNLQNRGRLFVGPNDPVYEGMVIGINNRDSDLVVNPMKEKKLTNVRASGTDESIVLSPPIRMSLEQSLEFINLDELVEITPKAIRIRKRQLQEHERRRTARAG
jgi:GTP-binding protein